MSPLASALIYSDEWNFCIGLDRRQQLAGFVDVGGILGIGVLAEILESGRDQLL
jgi:hypothetical protein